MVRFAKILPHEDTNTPIVVQGITVDYDGHHALDNVSFTLAPGERVAVVGPNGAGKSTLFKVMAGLLPPTSGSVSLFGGAPERHICVAYVPQRSEVDLSFPVTVRDVVLMGRVGKLGLFRWPGRADRRLVEECLALVGMTDLAERQIGELSGGQQQRVFIAQALAQEAQVMLLDEPFTGLDVNSQEDILAILEMLRRRKVTVLVSTHDLNQAAHYFDRVLLLNHRLIAFGPPAEVLTAQHLNQAYGEQLRLVETAEGVMAFSDTCCEGGQEPHEPNR
jgi:manganese/iron transport system ATP-binding protein